MNTGNTEPLVPASLHWLAEDMNGSQLVNFPFAFTVFMVSGTGLTTIGLGIVITNVWLSGGGFLAVLAGSLLYGWSLEDDSP